jgi:tartrate-resistant acid phosphatase type 5
LALLLFLLGACASGDTGFVAEDGGLHAPVDASAPDAAPPPPPPRVRFIAVGDAGKGNDGQRKVAAAMREVCAERGCDFIVMLGDNIYERGVTGADDTAWQDKFEQPYQDLDLPFYAVLGNHDYGGALIIPIPGLGNEWERGMYEVSYSQHSAKWIMPAHHYTFTHGHVGFIALDTNSLMWADTTYGDQRTWWPSALAEVEDKDWVFVLGHHPYRSSGTHGNAGTYDTPEGVPNPIPMLNGGNVKAFFDELVCGAGQVYFSGHDHTRQWLDMPDALCGTQMIVSGAGAEVTSLQDRGNQSFYQDASEPGFLYVDVEGDRFTGRFFDADGNLDYERSFAR